VERIQKSGKLVAIAIIFSSVILFSHDKLIKTEIDTKQKNRFFLFINSLVWVG